MCIQVTADGWRLIGVSSLAHFLMELGHTSRRRYEKEVRWQGYEGELIV